MELGSGSFSGTTGAQIEKVQSFKSGIAARPSGSFSEPELKLEGVRVYIVECK